MGCPAGYGRHSYGHGGYDMGWGHQGHMPLVPAFVVPMVGMMMFLFGMMMGSMKARSRMMMYGMGPGMGMGMDPRMGMGMNPWMRRKMMMMGGPCGKGMGGGMYPHHHHGHGGWSEEESGESEDTES